MKKILALTLTLAMTLSLAACGGSKPAETTAAPAATAAAETTAAAAETTAAPAETAAAAEKGSIQIKYSTWAGDGEAAYEGMKKFKEYIEADSNGVIEVLLYPSDQAGSTNEQVEQGRTFTEVTRLDHEGRVSELARIIGGVNITEAAVSHAEDMLRQNH